MAESVPDAHTTRILAQLPPGLRQLLDRELAAGNAIAWAGGGHPAPPIGACVMLTLPLQVGAPLPATVSRRDRNSSLYSSEFTAPPGDFFLLTPPGPPPEEPDMDAIRAAHQPPPFVPKSPHIPVGDWVELDIRGETLVYHAPGRRAYVEWTYTQGHRIYRSSLKEWFDTERKCAVPLDALEGDRLFARIVALARPLLGGQEIILCP